MKFSNFNRVLGVCGLTAIGSMIGSQASSATILKVAIPFSGSDEVSVGQDGATVTSSATLTAIKADGPNVSPAAELSTLSGTAAIGTLRASAEVYGGNTTREVNSSFGTTDVIFNYGPNALCQPNCTDRIFATLTAQISGTLAPFGGRNPDIASGEGGIFVSNIFSDATTTSLSDAGDFISWNSTEDGYDSFNGTLTASFWQNAGATTSISASIKAVARGGNLAAARNSGSQADFGNSLTLDPFSVFDVPEGVIVSSASSGIVDNRIAHLADPPAAEIPLPPAMLLGLTGIAALAVFRRRQLT